jgi:tRNA G18 (ribose-2'-O)-methylase SpoU
MASVTVVDDADDERLRPYVGLTDAEHRRRWDADHGTFVIEGVTAIRRALQSAYPVRSVLVTPAKARLLARDLDDVTVYVADPALMRAVTGFNIHRGAVAVAARRPLPVLAELLDGARLVAALEGLNDHENLGALARSAVGLGVDALVLDPTCADPLYRRSVRVSMGEILHLPFTRLAPWPDGLAAVTAAGFTVVALTPSPGAEPIDEVAASVAGQPVALLLGAEGPGLSSGAMAAADRRARIPVRIDSLNVGHAAAIAFHRFAACR